MKSTIIALFCVAAMFTGQLSAQESASNETAETRMDWFKQAKFGMFIHWGVYSMAAGEWNGETNHAEWLQLTAKIPLAEYTEYAKDFNPEKFNADQWVKIAKDAGMHYLVITSKHHDGFAMYDSACSDHNVIDGTAFKRDPLKELSQACAKHGVRFCVYYSLGRDWQDPDVPTGRGDKKGFRSNLIDFPEEDKKVFSRYFQRKVKPQVRELLTELGPIGIFWFDTYGLISKEESTELKKMIRTLQPECIINARIGHGLGDYKVSEQKIPADGSFEPWESCMTMNGHWSYNRADNKWKTTKKLLHNLIDIVSKGGNFLLNVGPTGEGEIPEPSVDRLSEIGAWLKTNGEAVYGCGPTPFGGELKKKGTGKKGKKEMKDWKWRATTKPGHIYVHVFEWPDGSLALPAVAEEIDSVSMLGGDPEQLDFEQDNSGVKITLPKSAPDAIASVVRIKLKDSNSQDGAALDKATTGKWITLFDGATMDGWEKVGKKDSHWEVKDGALSGSGTQSMLVCTKGPYKNFRYRAEVKINDGGNSGVYFRTPRKPTFRDGYEAQVDSTHKDPIRTGSLYGFCHVYQQHVKPDTWFTYELEVRDDVWRKRELTRIKVTVDGNELYEYLDFAKTFGAGHFAFQQHDPGSKVHIRKVEVMPLED